MALSRRNVVGEISGAAVGTGSFTTSSQTVNSGELLVVIVFSNSGGTISAANLTIADSGTGASYTSRQTFDATPSSDMAYGVWTGVATSTGSFTFTADAGADSTDTYSVVVFAYTGADTTNPIGATGNFSQTGEGTQNPSFTLGATPATTSEVVGFWGIDINTGLPTQAPGGTFTEQYNTGLSGHSCFEVETRTGSASTTVDLTDVNEAGGSVSGVGAIGFEMVAAAATVDIGGPPVDLVDPLGWMFTVQLQADTISAYPQPVGVDATVTVVDTYLGPFTQQPYWTTYERGQWLQANRLDVSTVQSVDDPPIPALPTVEWLRRRPDVEADPQPRRLLDLSVTQSVDAPIPIPDPPITWLRRRPDYETDQQPQRLVDTSYTMSIDSPPIILIGQWEPTAKRTQFQQAIPLPVDITSGITYVGPFVQQAYWTPAYERQQWLQARRIDTSYTMSVDNPPLFLAGQWIPTAKPVQGHQAVPLPIDIVAPPLTYLGPFVQQAYWTTPYEREQWAQARRLDVSTTQSVDSPPFILIGQWEPTSRRFQTQQPPLLALDIVTATPYLGPLGQQAQWRVYDYRQWRQARLLDLSVTQSVDNPPLHGPYQMAPYWVPPRRPLFFPVLYSPGFEIVVPLSGITATWWLRHPTATWVLDRTGTWRLRRTDSLEKDATDTWRLRDATETWETEE